MLKIVKTEEYREDANVAFAILAPNLLLSFFIFLQGVNLYKPIFFVLHIFGDTGESTP